MRFIPIRCLIVAASAALYGCEPRPVVVDEKPDAVDVDINAHPEVPAPRTGVDVNVGGGQGVDVNVTPNPSGANLPPPETKNNP